MEEEARKTQDILQISFNSEPPKSTKYTDDMFPLDDLVIVPGYSLESMAYGEKNPNYESDAHTLATFEQITHSMCTPEEAQVKPSVEEDKENAKPKKSEMKAPTPPKVEEDKENQPQISSDTSQEEEDDQGVIHNLVTMGVTIYSKFFQ